MKIKKSRWATSVFRCFAKKRNRSHIIRQIYCNIVKITIAIRETSPRFILLITQALACRKTESGWRRLTPIRVIANSLPSVAAWNFIYKLSSGRALDRISGWTPRVHAYLMTRVHQHARVPHPRLLGEWAGRWGKCAPTLRLRQVARSLNRRKRTRG